MSARRTDETATNRAMPNQTVSPSPDRQIPGRSYDLDAILSPARAALDEGHCRLIASAYADAMAAGRPDSPALAEAVRGYARFLLLGHASVGDAISLSVAAAHRRRPASFRDAAARLHDSVATAYVIRSCVSVYGDHG
jgi:hypothetical protein